MAARAVAHLFKSFRLEYGPRFVEREYDPAAWTQRLSPFTPKAIAAALQVALERDTEWPPTLATFRSLCKQYVGSIDERVDPRRSLTSDRKHDTPTAKKHRAIMRALSGVNATEDDFRELREARNDLDEGVDQLLAERALKRGGRKA